MKLTIKFSQFTVKNRHTLQSRCLGRTGWQNGVAYCRDMLQPGKLHVSLRTRSQALPTVARLCCRVSSTRFAVILSFFVSSILVLEAKTSVVTNEGNYEEESKLEYDDDSSVKRLIKASLKRPEIRGPALVPVADIPGVWTCSLEFESGDAEKWTLWKRSPAFRAHQRLQMSIKMKGTDGSPGKWAAQRAYVVELENGTFSQSNDGEAFAMNRTFHVQSENLLNTICAVCPERFVLKRTAWSSTKPPADKHIFWTETPSSMAGILRQAERGTGGRGALYVKGLLVFPSVMSYWASRRYQHAVMDLLPHLVPYIPFLKAHREVQVALPTQFHFFFLTLGLQPQQLLNTGANLFRAEKLYVGLFLDENGSTRSGQCASCCAACWRNPGLLSYFSTAVATFTETLKLKSDFDGSSLSTSTKQSDNAASNLAQCRWSEQFEFKSCYRTQRGDMTSSETRRKLMMVTRGIQTFVECGALALKANAQYFGMEQPESTSNGNVDAGKAECWLSGARKHIGHLDRRMHFADSEEECRVGGGDPCARYLGGKFRLAIYEVNNFRFDSSSLSDHPAVVYAARPDCYKPKCRTVVNHDDVVGRIQRTVSRFRPQMDVVVFNPEQNVEQRSFEYQVLLFRRAQVVIGAHGGALTNLMFMQPGCQKSSVIEFVGDKVSDVYAETHLKLAPPPYKSLHYAYFGSLVNYSLSVYDKVVSTSPKTPNRTSIPLDDLEVALAKKLLAFRDAVKV